MLVAQVVLAILSGVEEGGWGGGRLLSKLIYITFFFYTASEVSVDKFVPKLSRSLDDQQPRFCLITK